MYNQYQKYFADDIQTRIDNHLTKDNDTSLAILLHNHTGTINGPILYDFQFKEAVINVQPEVNDIEKIVRKVFKSNKGKQVNVILPLIESMLEKYKIAFKYNRLDLDKYIIGSNYEPNNYFIYSQVSNKVLKENLTEMDYENFVKEFINLLGHELVHRSEAIKMYSLGIAKRLLKKDPRQQILYYGSKYEIMSYAWQIVNEFRSYGKVEKDIEIILQSNSEVKFKYSNTLELYHKLFTIKDKALKLLYKYMYSYLNI